MATTINLEMAKLFSLEVMDLQVMVLMAHLLEMDQPRQIGMAILLLSILSHISVKYAQEEGTLHLIATIGLKMEIHWLMVCQICGKMGHITLECYQRNNFAYQGTPPRPSLAAMTA